MGQQASIRTLIAFLHDELATVASYRRALPGFAEAPDGDELRACLESHERRIATLEQRIRFLGGDPHEQEQEHEGEDHEGDDHEGEDHEGDDHEGEDHEGGDHEGEDAHDGDAPGAASSVGLRAGGDAGDAAIMALEASEDRGLKHYLDDVCKLDRDTRNLVAREILPEQVRTYDSLTDLKLTRRLL
jgi:hypothetical protein